MWHKKFNSEIKQWIAEVPKQKSYDRIESALTNIFNFLNNQKIPPIKLAENLNKLISSLQDYLLSLFISESMTLTGANKD